MKKSLKINEPSRKLPMGKFVLGLLALLLTFVHTSCTDDVSQKKQQDSAAHQKEVQILINAGFDEKSIQDKGSHFLVEGDIIIPKGSLSASGISKKNPNGRLKQWTNSISGLVGYSQQSYVSVKIDPSAEQWRDHIVAAVNFWNGVPNTRVNLYITEGTYIDVTVTGVPAPGEDSRNFGAAVLPSDGSPGYKVELNSNPGFIPGWRIRTTITHELGHTLGFLHSDNPGPNAVRVPGTPALDPNSIMNSGSAPNRNDPSRNDPTSLWPGFSNYDLQSIQTLYPEDYAGDILYTNDFYQFGNPDVGSDPTVLKNHWRSQGGPVEGRAGSPIFDPEFYRNAYPDFIAVGMDRQYAIYHWLNNGSNEGRASSPLFDVHFYLDNNPDLLAAFGSQGFQKAYRHWLVYGINEGRISCSTFNVRNYLARYTDLANVYGITGYKLATYHWYFFGRHEGRIGV